MVYLATYCSIFAQTVGLQQVGSGCCFGNVFFKLSGVSFGFRWDFYICCYDIR